MLQEAAKRVNDLWTTQDDTQLKALHRQGMTDKLIALQLPNRTPGAIHMRRVKLGINTRRPFTAKDDKILTQEYGKYVTLAEIAKKLHRSKGTLQQRIRLLGLHRDGRITKLVHTHGIGVLARGTTYEDMLAAIGRQTYTALRERTEGSRERIDKAVAKLKRELAEAGDDRGKRDAAIFKARAVGVLLHQIEEATGLSYERVRVLTLGVSTAKQMSIAKKLAGMTSDDYQATLTLAKEMRS